MSQDAANTAQISMLIDITKELKSTVSKNDDKAGERQGKTDEILNQLLQSHVRSEEQRIADRAAWERVEVRQDKQDVAIALAQTTATEAKSQALSNARWVNLGVALLTGVILYISKEVIDAMDWFTKATGG